MAKGEISWKSKTAEGERREVYAKKIGKKWIFYERERRYDSWEEVKNPSFEDFENLLDGVRRRIQRRLVDPREVNRIKDAMRQAYPEAEI